jgi:hypothetical protein
MAQALSAQLSPESHEGSVAASVTRLAKRFEKFLARFGYLPVIAVRRWVALLKWTVQWAMRQTTANREQKKARREGRAKEHLSRRDGFSLCLMP